MTSDVPRLYFSRRRMLNRLSFTPQSIHHLKDPSTGQDTPAALLCLKHLEAMGLATTGTALGLEPGWLITDAGVGAMAANGVIYSEARDA